MRNQRVVMTLLAGALTLVGTFAFTGPASAEAKTADSGKAGGEARTSAPSPPFEIGFLAGGAAHDRLLNPSRNTGYGPVFGGRIAARLGRRVDWFADGTWSTFTPDKKAQPPKRLTFAIPRTGFEFSWWPGEETPWNAFVAVAGGVFDVSYEHDKSTFRPGLASLGLGVERDLGSVWRLRFEVRGDRTLADKNNHWKAANTSTPGSGSVLDGVNPPADKRLGATALNYQALVGISWLFGGVARDSDGDGVLDKVDQCPDTPRGWPVDLKGCPLDSDGDGVPDGADKCPSTPSRASVNADGCPLDSDGDGVFDGIDQCPATPKGALVDAKGCTLDSDGDGVADGLDQCPGTAAEVKVDAKGCPLPAPPPTPPAPKPAPIFQEGKKSLILQGVNFESGKAVLTPESASVLDKVATSLRDWPDIRIEVGGYTDNVGRPATNLKLSEARAAAVRDYLIQKGVDASRLTSRGYGPEHPVADNSTPEGRAQNRRVELTRID